MPTTRSNRVAPNSNKSKSNKSRNGGRRFKKDDGKKKNPAGSSTFEQKMEEVVKVNGVEVKEVVGLNIGKYPYTITETPVEVGNMMVSSTEIVGCDEQVWKFSIGIVAAYIVDGVVVVELENLTIVRISDALEFTCMRRYFNKKMAKVVSFDVLGGNLWITLANDVLIKIGGADVCHAGWIEVDGVYVPKNGRRDQTLRFRCDSYELQRVENVVGISTNSRGVSVVVCKDGSRYCGYVSSFNAKRSVQTIHVAGCLKMISCVPSSAPYERRMKDGSVAWVLVVSGKEVQLVEHIDDEEWKEGTLYYAGVV